jgi:hypothetical protein
MNKHLGKFVVRDGTTRLQFFIWFCMVVKFLFLTKREELRQGAKENIWTKEG